MKQHLLLGGVEHAEYRLLFSSASIVEIFEDNNRDFKFACVLYGSVFLHILPTMKFYMCSS
jgi:hypothetical protein